MTKMCKNINTIKLNAIYSLFFHESNVNYIRTHIQGHTTTLVTILKMNTMFSIIYVSKKTCKLLR